MRDVEDELMGDDHLGAVENERRGGHLILSPYHASAGPDPKSHHLFTETCPELTLEVVYVYSLASALPPLLSKGPRRGRPRDLERRGGSSPPPGRWLVNLRNLKAA